MSAKRVNLIERDERARVTSLLDGYATRWSLDLVGRAIRNGECPPDLAFDRFLHPDHRAVSQQHWTPVLVAMRAAAWFEQHGARTVIDIGSGAGKFCVVAGLASACQYLGLEQRPGLVAAARELAEGFGVAGRVRFVEGRLAESQHLFADAYYLYNPFGENLFGPDDFIDQEVELSKERHARDVEATQSLLRRAPPGTLVVTYNGMGGRMPFGYVEIACDRETRNELKLWRKRELPAS